MQKPDILQIEHKILNKVDKDIFTLQQVSSQIDSMQSSWIAQADLEEFTELTKMESMVSTGEAEIPDEMPEIDDEMVKYIEDLIAMMNTND